MDGINKKLRVPSYDNNIVTLMNVIQKTLNCETGIPSLPGVKENHFIKSLTEAKNLILFVVDGLGYNYVRSNKSLVNLNKNMVGCIDSVFPSSTASGITSYLSGVSPVSHGIFGWFQWLPEIGILAKPLPFQSKSGCFNLHSSGISIEKIFKFPSIFEGINANSYSHSPSFISEAPFNVYATRGSERVAYSCTESLISNLKELCQQKEMTTYHYVYYPFFDSSCHEFGVDSEESFCEAQKIDNIAGLVEKEVCNKETLAIFVSDHGMIDIPRGNKLSASLFPNTIGLIDSAMSGEPRVSYCFVSESNKDKFESAFKYEMSQYAHLLELQKVFKNGWFGQDNGLGSTKYRKVIGDYAILMKDHYTLVDDLPGEPESCFIGMHGGLTEDEVLIPVMLIGG